MAERPDLDYAIPILERGLAGRVIEDVRVAKPVVLRLAVPGSPSDILVGRCFTTVTRHGHFVRFGLDETAGREPVELIVSPMLAGRFVLAGGSDKTPRDIAVTWILAGDDARELRYRDDVQMGKVYVIARGDTGKVPGFDRLGVDVLDAAAFTLERFVALAKKRRDQVKVFLMDKAALDSLGNAYADEALFEAGIHPKTWVRSLTDEDLAALHRAIPAVLGRAADEIARRRPATDVKLRDFLNVRGKHKQPCPRCQTPIRKAGVRGHDAFFCPSCQPETRKGSIVSWSKR